MAPPAWHRTVIWRSRTMVACSRWRQFGRPVHFTWLLLSAI